MNNPSYHIVSLIINLKRSCAQNMVYLLYTKFWV